ncbi:hypothetical protein [Thalassovita sp.]|uniref:hypothetical protein n=1 Tax=Thalassovita sp. TaxID=1979401 RepID=UPI002B268A28|nr:hypothetical protein [Thalassovita sp.]
MELQILERGCEPFAEAGFSSISHFWLLRLVEKTPRKSARPTGRAAGVGLNLPEFALHCSKLNR